MPGKDSPAATHRELIEQAEELLRPHTFNEEADTHATALAVIALYRLLDERLPPPDWERSPPVHARGTLGPS